MEDQGNHIERRGVLLLPNDAAERLSARGFFYIVSALGFIAMVALAVQFNIPIPPGLVFIVFLVGFAVISRKIYRAQFAFFQMTDDRLVITYSKNVQFLSITKKTILSPGGRGQLVGDEIRVLPVTEIVSVYRERPSFFAMLTNRNISANPFMFHWYRIRMQSGQEYCIRFRFAVMKTEEAFVALMRKYKYIENNFGKDIFDYSNV